MREVLLILMKLHSSNIQWQKTQNAMLGFTTCVVEKAGNAREGKFDE